MKIKLWSDLHIEFANYTYNHIWIPRQENQDEILILAGDIGCGNLARFFIEDLCASFSHVLMVCGNHEFYDFEFDDVIHKWQEFEEQGPKNFHFLHNDWRVIDGVRFLGGTMWTSLDDGDPLTMGYAHRTMTDYGVIKHNGKLITPEFTIAQHDKFIQFLLEKFEEDFAGPTVVITHHSPGNILKRRGHCGDRLDAAYFADIEDMIGWHNKARVWVHGHTHRNWDYMINETRVLCNPYGYQGHATNSNFDPDFSFEV